MSIASRIEQIEQHLTDDYSVLEVAGADLTNIDKNIVNLKPTWQERLLYFMDNGTEEVWNNWNKATGEGTSISLNNTLEAKMKIELKGNTHQGLPEGYTQVDYIESSGTQYIDTGISPNDNTNIETKVKLSDVTQSRNYICGCYSPGNTNRFQIAFIGDASNVNFMWCRGSIVTRTNLTLDTNNLYEVKTNRKTLKINSQDVIADGSFSTNSTPIILFGVNENGSVGSIANGEKIYYFKIYENDTLARDFIPCYRNSDNEIGMYDLVNDVFYTNEGTGTFTYGNIAPTPDAPQEVQTVTGNNTIKVCAKNLLNVTATSQTKNNVVFTVNSDGTILANGKANGTSYLLLGSVYLETNTTYFISGCGSGGSGKYQLKLYNRAETPVSVAIDEGIGISYTPTESGTYDLRLAYWYNYTLTNVLFKPMIEVGTSASTFEKYISQSYPINLGNTELCKIGNYQDYIFHNVAGNEHYDSTLNEGGWYINKQIGKVVLDGSESWQYWQGGLMFYIAPTTLNYLQRQNEVLSSSNYYICLRQTTSGNDFRSLTSQYDYAMSFANETNGLRLKNINITTANDFKDWLSTNNVIVYYALSTPTYEEITDSELLSQLNALEGARSYQGQTNINQENSNLASILNASALQEM